MKRTPAWILAIVLTLASAVFQRMTGPTYPLRGKIHLGDEIVRFRLPRSAETGTNHGISLRIPDVTVTGTLYYKRFKTGDAWTEIPMIREEGLLAAEIPGQPAAGKLAYRIVLDAGGKSVPVPAEGQAVIRFKGHVPAGILIPHIFFIFAAMVFSTRAGIAALNKKENPKPFAAAAALLMIEGGLVFGPLVQKYAFGVFWSGFPFGTDITDTKTLLVVLLWIAALVAGRRGRESKGWILAASIATLVVYLIPHSLFESEIKYQ